MKRKILQFGGVAMVVATFAQLLAATAVKKWSMVAYLTAGGIASLGIGTYLLVKTDSEDLLKKISELPHP
jgi:hypothetical protein